VGNIYQALALGPTEPSELGDEVAPGRPEYVTNVRVEEITALGGTPGGHGESENVGGPRWGMTLRAGAYTHSLFGST
jgi:hypothetical protein